MIGYLLDTNVISKFAPGRPNVPETLQQWMLREGALDSLFLSSMTIAEINKGVKRLHRKGSVAKAAALEDWLNGIISIFSDRILAMDLDVSLLVGEMEDAVTAKGFEPGLADVVIAATAKAHNLTIVTENVRHFELFDIALMTPLDLHPLK